MSERDKRDEKSKSKLDTDESKGGQECLDREPLLRVQRRDGRTYIYGEVDLEQLATEVDESLAHGFEKFRQTAEYSAQEALLEFIDSCHARKEQLKLSDAELSRLMEVSRSYVSRLLNATPNLTVVSLSKLARALGGKLRIKLVIDE
jgi:predicted transcriptional regulator